MYHICSTSEETSPSALFLNLNFFADLSYQSGGAPKRGQDRPDELRVQRAAEQEDHPGLHRQGRRRGRAQLRGECPINETGQKW